MLGNARVSVTLPVVNLERAGKFYKEKLGLKLADNQQPGGLSFVCGGGTYLMLYQRSTPSKADNTACAFEVDNVEREVDALSQMGVVFEQYDMPGLKTNKKGIAIMEPQPGHAAWFKDLDGNIIGIASFK
jgi:catechol 2,3-dioxygenase-like lactoylglutathione lyase family enzyme